MTYKEFDSWCNERARDGCWNFDTAIYCIKVLGEIKALPFWKRRKEWLKVKDTIETDVVSVINAKIQALKGGEE